MQKFMRKVKIGNKIIGEGYQPFLIAEIGCNFENSLDKAKEMVINAAMRGADAVKFQTFIADKLVTKSAPKFWEVAGCPGITQYEEFSLVSPLNLKQYQEINRLAEDNGIIFFSTAFDEESADLLEMAGVPAYKVASMDLTHLPLLRYVAKKKKPIILSTGASTLAEIKEAVATIESEGNIDIVLLHCITNYPTMYKDANLRMVQGLQEVFPEIPVGYSDHTIEDVSHSLIIAAVALGAKVIEKHFTFDKSRPGYDHIISADYKDMEEIRKNINRVYDAMGKKDKKPIISEEKIKHLSRRSLVSACNIKKGEKIRKDMLAIKRPGTGIPPKEIEKVIGRHSAVEIAEDRVISWNMISISK